MKSLSVVVAILVALVAYSDAQAYTWVGGTMSFDDPQNWASGFVPDNSTNAPCATRFGSVNSNIISTLGARRYFVGQQLLLPSNGILRLPSPGTAITFTVPTSNAQCSSSDTLNWVGGTTPNKRNDFYCHENWNLGGQTIDSPPCANDRIVFDNTETFHIQVDPSVKMILFSSITFGNLVVSDTNPNLRALMPQIDLLDTSAVVYLGLSVTPICSATGIWQYDSSDRFRPCKCFSSCPTAAMQAQYDEIVRRNAFNAGSSSRTAFYANATLPFSGTFTPSALNVSSDVFNANVNNATQAAILAAALRNALMSIPAYTASVTVAPAGANLRASGSVYSYSGALYTPGTTTLPTGTLSWAATNFPPSPTAHIIQSIIATTLPPLMIEFFVDQLISMADGLLPPVSPNVVDLLTPLANNPNAITTSATVPCFASCTTDCASCSADLGTALQTSLGLSPTDAANLANQLIAAKNATVAEGGDWQAVSNNTAGIVNLNQQLNTLQNQANNVAPQVYSYTSASFGLGRLRSASFQLRALMPENRNALMTTLLNSLNAATNLLSIGNVQVGWSPNYVSPARRRRAVNVELTPSALTVQFSYNVSCVPVDTACRTPINPSTTVGAALLAQLNNALSISQIASPQCQLLSVASPSFSQSCLNQVAADYCTAAMINGSSESSARLATQQVIYELTMCGLQPRYPNGSCFDTSEMAAGLSLASSTASSCYCASSTAATTPSTAPTTTPAATTTTTTTTASGDGSGSANAASASSGGSSMLPIIAAAAGGAAVLVLILVLLYLRKRRNASRTSQKAGADRNVVSFENPMYDDPAGLPTQPVYSGVTHEGDGLYDEPAFNTNSKQNPIYNSTEDLAYAGGGSGAVDGYLDVSPKNKIEDVGYLGNVADQPEDVGYLDRNPIYDKKEDMSKPE